MSIESYVTGKKGVVGIAKTGIYQISDGGRYQFFSGGMIYEHPGRRTLGFIPYGPVLETWWRSGYEHGYFGYPISSTETNINIKDVPFEGGRIKIGSKSRGNSVSILVYNTQLITPFGYKGRGRDKQVNRLIQILKKSSQDIICLNEVFDDDERDKISAHLRSTHPYRVDAPDLSGVLSGGLLEDGGLLLLSKHRIVEQDELVYRVSAGNDYLANKGIIHARVALNGIQSPPNLVDIYVTHLQADHDPEIFSQAKIAASYIASKSLGKVPALLVGDLNLDFNTPWSTRNSYYKLLSYPVDSWYTNNLSMPVSKEQSDKVIGITADSENAYRAGKPPLPIDDKRRGVHGKRIDAVFRYGARSVDFAFKFGKNIIRRYELEDGSGVDLSDHYGLDYDFNLRSVDASFDRRIVITGITVSLSKLHCLQTTSTSGDDEIKVLLRAGINGDPVSESDYLDLGDMGDGEEKHISNRSFSFKTPSRGITSLKCSVRVKEQDDWSKDELVGDVEIELSHKELLLSAETNGVSSTRNVRHPIALPLMRGDSCRYVAYITYKLDIVRTN